MVQPTKRSIGKNVVSTLILLVILVAGTVITYVWRYVDPQYVVSSHIHVAPAVMDPLTGEADHGTIANYESFMLTQALAITNNTAVFEKVADELAECGFKILKKRKQKLLDQISSPMENFPVRFDKASIKVEPIEGTEFLRVLIESPYPEEAKIVVNSVIRNYLADYDYGTTQQEERFLVALEDRAQVLKQKVEQKESEINKLLAYEFGDKSVDVQQNMIESVNEFKKQLAELETKRIDLEIQLELFKKGVDPNQQHTVDWEPLQQYFNQDEILKRYRNRLVDLKLERAEMADVNDVANAKVPDTVLHNIQMLIDSRKEVLVNEFEGLFAGCESRLKNEKLASVQNRLNEVVTHQERLQEIIQAQDVDTKEVERISLEIQDLELQLAMDREMYEKIRRRISQLQLQRGRLPRMSRPGGAEVEDYHDPRWKYSLITVFSAVGTLILLTIIRAWLGRKTVPSEVTLPV